MVKPFYVDTTGAWVFGYNQTQGAGSHLQAGARAELIPSPVTKALSTFGGRIAAQTMQYMFRGNVRALLNYAAFRPYAQMEAIKFALGDDKDNKVVLDPASGHSPVYYWLAQEFRHTDFVEIDTPKMMESKREALKNFRIPNNLVFQAADLTAKMLHNVYQEPVDVLVSNGAYVNRADFRDMLKYSTNIVKDDGCIVVGFPVKNQIENFRENATVFSRIVTQPVGALETDADIAMIFKDTGFIPTHRIKMSELAARYHKPIPMDVEVMVVAQRGIDSKQIVQDEIEEIVQLNEALQSAENVVAPFIELDPESFKRFPRRHRVVPPKKPLL